MGSLQQAGVTTEPMPITQKSTLEAKNALIQHFRSTRSSILEAAADLPVASLNTPFVGSWGILELLAHLRGWDLTNLQAAIDIPRGTLPAFYAEFDPDWASYNARLVAQNKLDDLGPMIASVVESQSELLRLLNQLSPQDVFGDHGVRRGRYKVTIDRLIQAETEDEEKHLQQVRGFLSSLREGTHQISA